MAQIKVDGLNECLEELRKLADGEVRKKMMETLYEDTNAVRDAAIEKAPERTGRLKESIIARMSDKESSGLVIADYPKDAKIRTTATKKQAIGSKEYYAFAVEYGTKNMSAEPFLKPALQSKRADIKEHIKQSLGELMPNDN